MSGDGLTRLSSSGDSEIWANFGATQSSHIGLFDLEM